jgi:hypothetical protein
VIKDNVGFGEWDWEELSNAWDSEKLEEWGLDVPDFGTDEILEAEEDDQSKSNAPPPTAPKCELTSLINATIKLQRKIASNPMNVAFFEVMLK